MLQWIISPVWWTLNTAYGVLKTSGSEYFFSGTMVVIGIHVDNAENHIGQDEILAQKNAFSNLTVYVFVANVPNGTLVALAAAAIWSFPIESERTCATHGYAAFLS